jgi:anti-anti-sigma regulatory factor
MAASQPRTVVLDVSRLPPDAATIDALARLQVRTRRRGCDICFRHPSRELQELVDFVGLAGILRVEPGRQTEEREDALRIEEERQLDDPAV